MCHSIGKHLTSTLHGTLAIALNVLPRRAFLLRSAPTTRSAPSSMVPVALQKEICSFLVLSHHDVGSSRPGSSNILHWSFEVLWVAPASVDSLCPSERPEVPLPTHMSWCPLQSLGRYRIRSHYSVTPLSRSSHLSGTPRFPLHDT